MANHKISGNCGQPNAYVYYEGTGQVVLGFVQADGTGAYITPSIPSDTYKVRPLSAIATFSPLSLSVVVTTANVTGQNFTATSNTDVLSFTQLGIDTFQRANENPLNPTSWENPSAGLYAGAPLQIVSD